MAIIITKKVRTILLIALGVLVIGGGGFLIWRINQEDTVAPEDSSANYSEGCSIIGSCYKVGNDCVGDCGGGNWRYCDSCDGTSPGDGGDLQTCTGCGNAKDVTCTGDNCCQTVWCCDCFGWKRKDQGKLCYQCSAYGRCGTLNLKSFPYTQTSWPEGETLCDPVLGGPIPASPKFPAPGETVTWKCEGTGGASLGQTCSASTKAAPKYTVTYDGNGGTCTPATRSVTSGTASAAPTCTRDSYNLAGFKRTAGGASSGNLNNETGRVGNVTAAQTIEAQWSESCGDGTCAADENVNNCPVDCPAECGDNYCTHDENAATCPDDCDASCGDGYCTHDEDAASCPADCDTDCGDGLCTGDETALTCPADCDAECGDGYCTGDEDSTTCPADCEAPIQGGKVPDTGVFDTVIGRISMGVSFIFLGGLVSQYSRLNYFFNSVSERNRFKRDIKKQRKMDKDREKLENRFK